MKYLESKKKNRENEVSFYLLGVLARFLLLIFARQSRWWKSYAIPATPHPIVINMMYQFLSQNLLMSAFFNWTLKNFLSWWFLYYSFFVVMIYIYLPTWPGCIIFTLFFFVLLKLVVSLSGTLLFLFAQPSWKLRIKPIIPNLHNLLTKNKMIWQTL